MSDFNNKNNSVNTGITALIVNEYDTKELYKDASIFQNNKNIKLDLVSLNDNELIESLEKYKLNKKTQNGSTYCNRVFYDLSDYKPLTKLTFNLVKQLSNDFPDCNIYCKLKLVTMSTFSEYFNTVLFTVKYDEGKDTLWVDIRLSDTSQARSLIKESKE